MSRETWVYPADGGDPYLKGTREETHSYMIMPDLPDFVSPIDGKQYSGRTGMREHNKRHDVVPNAELKGLPTLTASSDQRTSEQKKASANHRKEMLIQQVNRHYR